MLPREAQTGLEEAFLRVLRARHGRAHALRDNPDAILQRGAPTVYLDAIQAAAEHDAQLAEIKVIPELCGDDDTRVAGVG
jgi:hypothetical protein